VFAVVGLANNSQPQGDKDAGVDVHSEDDDASTPQKKNRKRKNKTVLAVESSGDTKTTKEVAGCDACREAAAGEKAGKTGGPYYKIHRTKGHNLQQCWQVEQLAEKQKQE
jgi:hypothetical protein